jgi:hypothetical protein
LDRRGAVGRLFLNGDGDREGLLPRDYGVLSSVVLVLCFWRAIVLLLLGGIGGYLAYLLSDIL